MSNITRTPNRSLVAMTSPLTRIFEDFFGAPFGSNDIQTSTVTPWITFKPSVDVIETEDNLILKADMPGMDKGNIKVVADDGLLTIEGTRNETREEDSKGVVRSERFVGTFRRSFNLPTWADTDKINANYKNGVLEVSIPRAEAAKPKEIQIKVS